PDRCWRATVLRRHGAWHGWQRSVDASGPGDDTFRARRVDLHRSVRTRLGGRDADYEQLDQFAVHFDSTAIQCFESGTASGGWFIQPQLWSVLDVAIRCSGAPDFLTYRSE